MKNGVGKLVVALLAWALANSARASDPTPVLYFFWGASALVAFVIGVIVHYVARRRTSLMAKALIWGAWCALVLTPIIANGFNGTMHATPIVGIAVASLGGDPRYGWVSLIGLVIAFPVWAGLIYGVLRTVRKSADDVA